MAKAVPAVSAKKAKGGGTASIAGGRSWSFAAPASLRGKLAKLGLNSDFDLVLHLPLRYEDETHVTPIAAVRHGAPVLVEGEVLSSDVAYRPRRQLVLKVRDESGVLFVRFLNFYPSHARSLAAGARVRLFGEVRPGFFGGEMVHPRFRVVRGPEPLADALTPVYPTTAGLPQAVLRRMVNEALDRADVSETLPEEVRERLGLVPFADAVRALHRPAADADAGALEARTHPAWRRMKFDELLGQQLSMRLHYRARRRDRARALAPAATLTTRLLDGLPFRLTRAQVRVWNEIQHDLAETHPMNRLLQGDVGSGKTGGRRARRAARGGERLADRGDGADRDPGRAASSQVRRMARTARRARRAARGQHGCARTQGRRAPQSPRAKRKSSSVRTPCSKRRSSSHGSPSRSSTSSTASAYASGLRCATRPP